MKRELKEKLGIEVDDNELKLIKTLKREKVFRDCYIIKKDILLKDIKFNDNEVMNCKYVTLDEFKEIIKSGNSTFTDFSQTIFDELDINLILKKRSNCDMKVITIKQPFASLIAEGIKEYEFRTWKTKYRGEILIHAGKSIDKKAMQKFEKYNLDYPTGCIIAKVNLTDCIKIDDEARKMLKEKNSLVYSSIIKHTEWNGYGFKIENVKKIEPIFLNGKLSLWDYDYK